MTKEVKNMLRLAWLGFGLIMCIGFTAWALLTNQAWWVVAINIAVGIYTLVRLMQLTGSKED